VLSRGFALVLKLGVLVNPNDPTRLSKAFASSAGEVCPCALTQENNSKAIKAVKNLKLKQTHSIYRLERLEPEVL
jgi:hypothetical protein